MPVNIEKSTIYNQNFYEPSENSTISAKLRSNEEKKKVDAFAMSQNVTTSKLIKQALMTRKLFTDQNHYKLQHYHKEVRNLLDSLPDLTIVEL